MLKPEEEHHHAAGQAGVQPQGKNQGRTRPERHGGEQLGIARAAGVAQKQDEADRQAGERDRSVMWTLASPMTAFLG